MNFHEYQAKQLLAEYGIPVPAGKVAATADEAVAAAQSLGNGPWMVKAQIHAGGRGKAGGVKFCKTVDDVKAAAGKMLGTKMATYQTAGVELPVNLVLVTTAGEIVKELYLSVLVDRGTRTITYIASSEGGVEIEQVAAETPDKIHSLNVDFVEGVQPYQGREFGFKMGLTAKQAGQFANIMVNLYRIFNEKDLALVEINPLAILDDGNLYALDGKFNSDDNASFRHKDLVAMRDKSQEDETEVLASEMDINYVTMDGNIGCMVNGAGLAMATMDIIKLNGAFPANFLRHYYDVYCLLGLEEVRTFMNTPAYQERKSQRFRTGDEQVIARNPAFLLADAEQRQRFAQEYRRTAALYYQGQPDFDVLVDRIHQHIELM